MSPKTARTVAIVAVLSVCAILVRVWGGTRTEKFETPSFDHEAAWGPEGMAMGVYDDLFNKGDGDVYQGDDVRSLPSDFVPGIPSVPVKIGAEDIRQRVPSRAIGTSVGRGTSRESATGYSLTALERARLELVGGD